MKAVLITILILFIPLRAYGQSAEELATQGQAAYDAGNYDGAVQAWTKSYELSKQPGLLYNIAQANRLGERCTEALMAYQKFLELDPTSSKVELAQQFVEELTPKCGKKSVKPAEQPVKPAEQPVKPAEQPVKPAEQPVIVPAVVARPHPGRTKRISGLTTVAGGVLLVGLGAYFGHSADVLGDEVSRECQDGCVWSTVSARDAEGKRDEKLQWAFIGLGSAAIVTGAVVYYFGWKADGEHVAVQPVAGGHGAALTWSRAW